MPPAVLDGSFAHSLPSPVSVPKRRAVIHMGQGTLLMANLLLAGATLCAALSLRSITWLAGTFGLLVLAGVAVWRWVALCIVVDGTGIVIGTMFGIDRKLAYRDIQRVHFIYAKTGRAAIDWKVDRAVADLHVPFEKPPATPHLRRPALRLRIEPKLTARQSEVRLDLQGLHRLSDIEVLYEHLPRSSTFL
ncbi:MAG: hypothetical protein V4510_04460 [bacterium]